MNDWLTWQIVDSAFPTGLFAHSWGLESARQHGEVPDGDALRHYVEASIHQTGLTVLPFVNATYRNPASFETLDAVAEAFLSSAVANRASRIQGRTLLTTTRSIWPSPALDAVQTRARQTKAHIAPLSGMVFRAVGVPLVIAQRTILYSTVRGVLSAAIRLGIVGTYEAQRVQYASTSLLEEVASRCTALTMDDLAQPSPVPDVLQARHDTLYSRLFQS